MTSVASCMFVRESLDVARLPHGVFVPDENAPDETSDIGDAICDDIDAIGDAIGDAICGDIGDECIDIGDAC